MNCNICPKKCNVDRKTTLGFCRAPYDYAVSKAMLHMWEEPAISGEDGSGTIFFAGCNMKCVFCQNFEISQLREKNYITMDDEKLSDVMISLMEKNANNINLVSPMHYADRLPAAIRLAKEKGLDIPVVYNTNSYELVETLSMLDGLVDVYLADFKYVSAELSKKYSGTKDYFEYADKAVREMFRQVGETVYDENGLIKKGVIVRILLLPGHVLDAKAVFKKLFNEYGNKIAYSLMNQYCPLFGAKNFPEINRDVTAKEYNRFVNFALEMGFTNGFIQGEKMRENGTKSIYTPDFDLGGLDTEK